MLNPVDSIDGNPIPATTGTPRRRVLSTLAIIAITSLAARCIELSSTSETDPWRKKLPLPPTKPPSSLPPAPAFKAITNRSHTVTLRSTPHKAHGTLRCDVLLNLFTTFIDNDDPRKIAAQANVLLAYQRLTKHGVLPWLFTSSQVWAARAARAGVIVVGNLQTNSHGTPFLPDMFETIRNITETHCNHDYPHHVFDAYSNGDIAFTKGLVDTLQEVRRVWGNEIRKGRKRGVLVVGKRTNVDFFASELQSDAQIEQLARKGKTFQNDAIDYFAYLRGTVSWQDIPQFVVGRVAYDNWLVHNLVHSQQADLVDASLTILSLHLTASDGNFAGHSHRPDKDWNKHVTNPLTGRPVASHEWTHGRTDSAHFFTQPQNSSRICFTPRRSPQGKNRTMPELAVACP